MALKKVVFMRKIDRIRTAFADFKEKPLQSLLMIVAIGGMIWLVTNYLIFAIMSIIFLVVVILITIAHFWWSDKK
ncbi:hypothetical protein HMPREF9103_03205 [Lentilactobacillus parafarraginis F0439]|uniref:Uncharacterized protein n=1 Tax=Lentilactobacillus parafarraginis F0439 TaxID=797515 RepID=G9ZTX0_9LACO|nr:hypothetical protein [Lentilactobacillus parafarraginis]EHL95233.1 hypothetical protein HMPREF9103_03205 [Lentilactobacillus parafarraginis F0439]